MSSIVFTNPFDAVTDDKEEATYLQARAILLILLRDILDERTSNLPAINSTNEFPLVQRQELDSRLSGFHQDQINAVTWDELKTKI